MTETIAKAARASSELRETDAAYTKLRQDMLESIARSPHEARDEREAIYLSIRALDKLRDTLRSVVDAGRIEEHCQTLAES